MGEGGEAAVCEPLVARVLTAWLAACAATLYATACLRKEDVVRSILGGAVGSIVGVLLG